MRNKKEKGEGIAGVYVDEEELGALRGGVEGILPEGRGRDSSRNPPPPGVDEVPPSPSCPSPRF